jgi:hypothetical protein
MPHARSEIHGCKVQAFTIARQHPPEHYKPKQKKSTADYQYSKMRLQGQTMIILKKRPVFDRLFMKF